METTIYLAYVSDDVKTEVIRYAPKPVRQSPLRQFVAKVVGLLVAEHRATVDTVVSAPSPLQPIDLTDDARVTEVLELAERVGEVVLASGTAVTDTKTQVEFIAATYGLAQCDIDVTYNSIRISADRGPTLPPATTMRMVSYRSLDFTRLAAVDRLTRRIRREMVPPDEAHAALDAITSAPHPYNRWVATGGWSLMAAAISLLLGGDWKIAAVSFLTTAAIDRANRSLNKRGLLFFFQHMVGGAVATGPAILLANFGGPINAEANASLIVAAGITVLLSGLSLVGSVEDAITGAPITGAARLLELMVMTGGIVAGVALALSIAHRLNAESPYIDMYSTMHNTDNLTLKIAAGAVASAAFALACYAERRALAAAAISGAAATVCDLFIQSHQFGPVVSAGAAATVVGLAGGLMARRSLTPPLVVAVAGITPLLPGFGVYRGLSALLNRQPEFGMNQLLAAIGTSCALAAGVTLGEWITRFLHQPRLLRRFQGIRRPSMGPGQ